MVYCRRAEGLERKDIPQDLIRRVCITNRENFSMQVQDHWAASLSQVLSVIGFISKCS